MSSYKIGFIGSGKMATAIAAGVVNKNIFSPDQILASDISLESLSAFNKACSGDTCSDNDKVVNECPVIILAIKPQVAETVCSTLNLPADTHIISIAAGLKIDSLKKWLKTDRVTRVMPNTPLMVGKGASAYCCSPAISEEEQQMVEKIFGSAGIIHRVQEKDIDAVTGVSGSGPAYVFEFIQALADAGVANGLSPEAALELAVQTVSGAAEMVALKMGTPDELRDAVTSPNGTTYAALQVFKQKEFRKLIDDAVDAAVQRSIELGNGKK